MGKLTAAEHKDGYYHFYRNGRDITSLWMDFFSGLSMKQEKNAHWIFAKKYTKQLDKQFPTAQPNSKRGE